MGSGWAGPGGLHWTNRGSSRPGADSACRVAVQPRTLGEVVPGFSEPRSPPPVREMISLALLTWGRGGRWVWALKLMAHVMHLGAVAPLQTSRLLVKTRNPGVQDP